jgi:hypothetical protein
LLEIVSIRINSIISAYWDEFAQNRWIFAISPNTGGSKYFPRKCGGFLELTRHRREEAAATSSTMTNRPSVLRIAGQMERMD